ncbi:hypothetical protein JCM19240_5193 [Vibrio maritimus]|uniref:Uncharacterized protein n=1 Tax=Vibrio maritimus TaxID=990268 RepID=A0A090TK70_9VIBR|nr:hypothetical protein JCM19240_5193 [Vibrio maritimus]
MVLLPFHVKGFFSSVQSELVDRFVAEKHKQKRQTSFKV